jgi:hypothetical protein
MADHDATLQIRSEASGAHWVAWVADASGKPQDAIVLVGENREEAEKRAKDWGERCARRGV